MNLISIQSHVAYGHVGNSAAVFPLQRMGVEVWPIHTVQFSNHTGYGDAKGRVFDAALIRDVVAGIEARGVLNACDGVLSGYMGNADIGAAILDSLGVVKRANPEAHYCCDPVIGDVEKGVFVRKGVPEFIKNQALPQADIVTPNQFELDFLAGRGSATMVAARDAIKAIHDLGPRVVLVTSLHTDETPDGELDMLASDETGLFRLRTPKLDVAASGAGDVIAALFFAQYLEQESTAVALANAGSAIFGVLAKTAEGGCSEIQVVTAQNEIVHPSRMFEAEQLDAATAPEKVL